MRLARSGPVPWLAAQAIAFGAWAALLGIVANAMFLDAFGSGWLPVTYIVIGIAGIAVSAAIRRGAERFDLLRLAVAVLGGATGLFLLAWVVAARGDAAWVSAPLLVVFPILIQLGFVFIGGQAGRVLDIAGIKASFPRIMAGFPIGAAIGGLVAVPLVGFFGRVEDLLLVTAIVQGSFAAVLWATGRRFARQLAPQDTARAVEVSDHDHDHDRAQLSLRGLLGRPFVALVLAYQVLSALGSQVADFLVFDRASALYPGAEDLGRFVAAYTAVMNGVAIAFLFALAGPLLRRYGLRLGIGANPVVDLVLALGILVVLVAAGPASFLVLGMVSAARIADIALTDGMTRTSINALYQVLPARQRLVAQATVEGMGVPIAIGASGVLILLLDALPGALALRVIVLAVICAAWGWVAARLYREYGPALAGALRSRRVLDLEAPIDASLEDVVALGILAAGTDRREARLARDLAALVPSSVAPEITPTGARGLPALPARDVPALLRLFEDPAPEVRAAALDAVGPGDELALDPAIRALLASRTASAAAAAIGRLGDAAVPRLGAVLDDARVAGGSDAGTLAARMVRAVRLSHVQAETVLLANLDHPDRPIGLLVMERFASATPASGRLAPALDRARVEDLEHAARALAALTSILAAPTFDPDAAVASALEEELDVLARRIGARLEARFGREEIAPVLARLRRDPGQSALAIEALEVTLGRAAAAEVVAMLMPGLAAGERLDRLSPFVAAIERRSAEAWLLEIATDAQNAWRSPWLRACAVRALRLAGVAAAPATIRLAAAPGTAASSVATDPTLAEELALVPA